jgi:hypothetical protein
MEAMEDFNRAKQTSGLPEGQLQDPPEQRLTAIPPVQAAQAGLRVLLHRDSPEALEVSEVVVAAAEALSVPKRVVLAAQGARASVL